MIPNWTCSTRRAATGRTVTVKMLVGWRPSMTFTTVSNKVAT